MGYIRNCKNLPNNIWNKEDFDMCGLGEKNKFIAKIKHIKKCIISSVTIGTIPWINGTESSAIGMHAKSAIIKVATNSKGCISPIWRLPIKRKKTSKSKYKIITRRKITNILLVCLFFRKKIPFIAIIYIKAKTQSVFWVKKIFKTIK